MAALNQETPAWSTKLLAMLTSNSIPPYMKKATKFAIIDIPIDRKLIINLPPKFNRSNTVAERSKESEFSAKIIECEIMREENQYLFLGSRLCFSPSKSSNLAPSAVQKKINTEFTSASDEKCTSESVPQTSDKMNM
jgi:hypothetical protein